jgi:uncharacterized membrane protein YciS (DUF1049 family)
MLVTILFSVLVLLLVGWVLRVNAKDRKAFERQLKRQEDQYRNLETG